MDSVLRAPTAILLCDRILLKRPYHTKTIYTLEMYALEQTPVLELCSCRQPETFHSFLEKQLIQQYINSGIETPYKEFRIKE